MLRPGLLGSHHTLQRYPVREPLTPYVEWFWAVSWDLPDRTRQPAPVLSHPCVHATLEGDAGTRHGHRLPAALVHGVVTRRFETELSGRGWVVGARFRPGGFAALTGLDAAELTDRAVRFDAAGSPGAAASMAALDGALRTASEDARIEALATWWEGLVPEAADASYAVVAALVGDVAADRTVVSVEALARRHGLSTRSVQRLVRWYVGVPPTWLIRRYRLQDALAELQADPSTDLAALATSLGWYDQAHFTRDFRAAVGQPPATYLRTLR